MSCWEAVWKNYWEVSASFREAIRGSIHLDSIARRSRSSKRRYNASSPFSLRLAQYVLEHYDRDLSLENPGGAFQGNAAYIGQIFKRDMHKSFSDYLKDVRMEKAKELLENSSLSAKDIAVKVGFRMSPIFHRL